MSSPQPAPDARTPEGREGRQCGRCRRLFDGDPTLHAVAIPEWWVCDECRIKLFGSPR